MVGTLHVKYEFTESSAYSNTSTHKTLHTQCASYTHNSLVSRKHEGIMMVEFQVLATVELLV